MGIGNRHVLDTSTTHRFTNALVGIVLPAVLSYLPFSTFSLIPRYIDFLYRVLSNNELPLLEETQKNLANSGGATGTGPLQFSGSGILAHEKLSYLFSVWRMEGDWSNGSSSGSSSGKE